MKIHMPCSDSMVTIKIDPNITHYEDKPKATDPRINIRQAVVYQDTEETQTLIFDFKDNNVQKVVVGNKSFEIKLLNIGRKSTQGQNFPEFEFLVKEE
jgi:hypothetical protein